MSKVWPFLNSAALYIISRRATELIVCLVAWLGLAWLGLQKTVISVDVNSQKCKQRALQSVAGLEGIDQVSIDMKEKKLTVIGEADPVLVVLTVRKQFKSAQLISVGPAKEEKKDGKQEAKKEPEKKDDKKGEQKSDGKKEQKNPPEPPVRICYGECTAPEIWYRVSDNWHVANDENANSCAIC